MRAHVSSSGGWACCAAALLLGSVLCVACAGSRSSQRAGGGGTHPTVDTGLDTCASCHAQVSPTVTAQWRDGRHGMTLVECVVCHGSTGADFKARPGTTACSACHPVEVASVTRAGTTQACFGCHPAHSLRAAGQAPHDTESRP